MPISSYPQGFAQGVALRNMPVYETFPAKVFYVDSGAGLNNGRGTYDRPFATLQAALDKCTANAGDIIFLMPNHSESVTSASSHDVDVTGVKIIGIGRGLDRPKFTMDTAITATFTVSANRVEMHNVEFVNGIDNLTAGLTITGNKVLMTDILTRDDDSNYHADDFIVVTSSQEFELHNWTHDARGGKTGAQTALSIVGGQDIVIRPRFIWGDFATAAIENVTTASSNLRVFGSASDPCFIRNVNSADVIFTAVATSTGQVGPFIYARVADDAANITEAFVGADMNFFDPIYVANADGERGLQWNGTASSDS